MILEIFVFLLAVYFISLQFKSNKNFPPGPWCIPYIGRPPPVITESCVKKMEKYGKIFMQTAGVQKFVFICDFKLAKEAFSKTELADRPPWKAMAFFQDEKVNFKANGIIFSNGDHWNHNRRFLLRHLRDLGMGKSKLEGIIMREVESLVEDFKSLVNQPDEIPFSVNVAVLNIIWQLVAGIRFEFDDQKVKKLMKHMNQVQEFGASLAIADFFPILRYIVPPPVLDYLLGTTVFDKACSEFENIVYPVIDEHVKNLNPTNLCDLMDDYLIEMKEEKSDNYAHFSYDDLKKITFDLFMAGNDTTANTIRFVLLYMAKFQSVQKKIQALLDNVVSLDTFPGLEHRDQLAYLDATINEVQRHASMLPFGVSRYAVSDLSVGGYLIPKGAVVIAVAGIYHRDETYWKDPDVFDPLRFLDENGKYISVCDGFSAFGLGKRQCLGEHFARMDLYLSIAALLKTFTFGPPEGEEIDISPHVAPFFQFPNKDQKFKIQLR